MKRTSISIYACLLFVWFCTLSLSATADAATPTFTLAFSHEQRGWIPVNENTCEITVTLTHAPANSWAVFQLLSTNWHGYCMNAGDKTDDSPDLKLLEASQYSSAKPTGVSLDWDEDTTDTTGTTLKVRWGDIAPTQFILVINCYDYGAIGKINAGLYNGADAQGNRQFVTASLMIPYEHEGGPKNYIPDLFEEQADNPATPAAEGWGHAYSPNSVIAWSGAAGDDTERGPGSNANPGDGLSAFEEYRGFMIKGGHKRTSPRKKDVFVYSEFSTIGIGWATNLPDIFQCWLLNKEEMEDFDPKPSDGSPPRKKKGINFLGCGDFHVLNQKAL